MSQRNVRVLVGPLSAGCASERVPVGKTDPLPSNTLVTSGDPLREWTIGH